MYGFLARRKHRPALTHRLRCESLEARDCPALPPAMLSFEVTRLQGHAIQVSGMIWDESPATAQVRLSGVATGVFNVNAQGYFSGEALTTGFGQIAARAYDSEGFLSKCLYHNYQNLPPSISYQVEQSGPAQFRIFGVVTDEDPNLARVNIGGLVSASVTPEVNGNFTFTFNSSILGGMNIRAVDSIGQNSFLHNFQLPNQAPVIAPFYASQQGYAWIIQGRVADEAPAGLTVTFHSGIPSIDGRTTTVLSDGSFYIVAYLKWGESGVVSAQTTDWFGIASNTAYTWVG
jgi:hypothetical protein